MTVIQKLLFVDDERDIREIASEYFGTQYQVKTADSAAAARKAFESESPDIAVLDVRMPGEDGLTLARWIREQHPETGVIMLTTAAEVVDRVIGLELGADDYIAKPFDLRELSARIKSLLRRMGERHLVQLASTPAPQQHRITLGRCELCIKEHRLFGADGEEIPMTAMEFDLLKVFIEHPNKVLNRDQIMALAHHRDWDVFDRSIDLRVMRLRRKIEANPDKPEVLKTVRGSGYILVL